MEYTRTGYDCPCSQQEAKYENKQHLPCGDFSNVYEQALTLSI